MVVTNTRKYHAISVEDEPWE